MSNNFDLASFCLNHSISLFVMLTPAKMKRFKASIIMLPNHETSLLFSLSPLKEVPYSEENLIMFHICIVKFNFKLVHSGDWYSSISFWSLRIISILLSFGQWENRPLPPTPKNTAYSSAYSPCESYPKFHYEMVKENTARIFPLPL